MIEINVSVIVLAIITGYIAYQFNIRSKRQDRFLKELSNSYNEVYFPMYESLRTIIKTEDENEKDKLIDDFFERYSNTESTVRFMGPSFLLEYFYELNDIYQKYRMDKKTENATEMLERVKNFYNMVEKEFWNAHDIIYEDHVQFSDDAFNNPFFVVVLSILRVFYHFTTFALGASFLALYFAILNQFIYPDFLPKSFNISNVALSIFVITVVYGVMLTVKTHALKKNRRENKIIKKFKNKWFKDVA